MARAKLIRTSEFPYHIVARTNNKDWFRIDMHKCWLIFGTELEKIVREYSAKIGSFVLMSNHFHMILWTPLENIDIIMNNLLRDVSKKINRESRRINHVFGDRYKWCIIENKEYLAHAYKYNIQNPLKAGICEKVEDYEFSTFSRILQKKKLIFPVHDQIIHDYADLSSNHKEMLTWLNQRFSISQNTVMSIALNRKIFEFPKHKQYRKTIRLF